MSGPKKVKNWWVILRRWENILLKRIISRFEDFSFRMFWNSRRLLFSKTFYLFWNIRRLLFSNVLEYSKTSLFEYSFSFQNVLIDRTTKILLLATKLTTFPNNHEKQAERCIKIHTLVYRRIRWISQRASSKNALRRFLSYFLLYSLSFSLCVWVLFRSATIDNW